MTADEAYEEDSRDDGTPTWEALEEVVGSLEQGHTVAFSSGMAGVAAVFDQLQAGAKVVIHMVSGTVIC